VNQPALSGSATILAFRPRNAEAPVLQARPAEISQLFPRRSRALEISSSPVVDIDAWYHTEAMHDAAGVRH